MDVSRNPAGAAIWKVVAMVAIIVGAVVLFVPLVMSPPANWRETQVLANMRSLQLAIAAMSFDTLQTGKDGIVWTSMRENGKLRPATLRELFAALTDHDAYLTESDLRKLLTVLTAPGYPPVDGPRTADNIPFQIFWVDDRSPADQPVIATKNWRGGALTADAPFGMKGFVFYTKDGSGGVKRDPKDARNFPTGRDAEGREYRSETLK